jgi:hypothetical protein
MTRSSDAMLFLQHTERKKQIQHFIGNKYTVVRLSFSLHHSILLEQDLHHELMHEFDLNIVLDLINDVEFHQKI